MGASCMHPNYGIYNNFSHLLVIVDRTVIHNIIASLVLYVNSSLINCVEIIMILHFIKLYKFTLLQSVSMSKIKIIFSLKWGHLLDFC